MYLMINIFFLIRKDSGQFPRNANRGKFEVIRDEFGTRQTKYGKTTGIRGIISKNVETW